MQTNSLFDKIRAGQVVLGFTNMYPASGIIEGTCKGWDFVWIDGQHGQHSYPTVMAATQATAVIDVDALIRVPSHESGALCTYADLSPSAIMVPMVNNAAEARSVAEAVRFPPLGKRSYGGRRVIDLNGREYYRERELMLVAQIETREGVDHAQEIIETEGIDVLFFSPDDMKAQLGLPINTPAREHPQLLAGMERVAEVARAAGKFCGMPARTSDRAAAVMAMGYQLLGGGNDALFLRLTAADALKDLREVIGRHAEPQGDQAAAPEGANY